MPLNAAFVRFEINCAKRIAAFLAQIGHESSELRYVRELGSDHYLGKYDTGSLAARLGNRIAPKRMATASCTGAED
jgi:putative chitinase